MNKKDYETMKVYYTYGMKVLKDRKDEFMKHKNSMVEVTDNDMWKQAAFFTEQLLQASNKHERQQSYINGLKMGMSCMGYDVSDETVINDEYWANMDEETVLMKTDKGLLMKEFRFALCLLDEYSKKYEQYKNVILRSIDSKLWTTAASFTDMQRKAAQNMEQQVEYIIGLETAMSCIGYKFDIFHNIIPE